MEKEKKKLGFFEKIEITDPEYAQKMYNNETVRFKRKLICAGIALVGSLCGFFMLNHIGTGGGFLSDLLSVLWLLGFVAAIVAGSLLNFFKIIIQFGKIAYYIVPFVFIGAICFVFGAAVGFIVCFAFPIVPCGITVYQSYKNLKESKNYLASYYYEKTSSQHQN